MPGYGNYNPYHHQQLLRNERAAAQQQLAREVGGVVRDGDIVFVDDTAIIPSSPVEEVSTSSEEPINSGQNAKFLNLVFPSSLEDGQEKGLRPIVEFECKGGVHKSHQPGNIVFPAPSSFAATDSATYGTAEMGFLAKKAMDAVSSARQMVDGGASMGQAVSVTSAGAVKGISDMVSNFSGEGGFNKLAKALALREVAKKDAGKLGALEAVPGADGLAAGVAIAMGVTQNKNITTEFTGVSTRSFSFSYELVPSNRSEGEVIGEIINIFRRAIYPSKDNFGALLRYPPKWKIRFLTSLSGSSEILASYPAIAECYLTSFATTYNENNSFHVDGTPVKTTITMTFQEDRALTVEDIDDLSPS